VEQSFSGDIEGEGSVEWVMAYRSDGSAEFVGLQRVTGTVDGRSGTLVLSSNGTFDGGAAKGTWKIIEGVGNGELLALKGEGTFEAPLGPKASFTLRYET